MKADFHPLRLAVRKALFIRKSIRLKLIVVFLICLIAFIAVYGVSTYVLGTVIQKNVVELDNKLFSLEMEAQKLSRQLNQDGLNDPSEAARLMRLWGSKSNYTAYVTDTSGNVLYGTSDIAGSRVDLRAVNEQVMNTRVKRLKGIKQLVTLYPVQIGDSHSRFLIVSVGISQALAMRKVETPVSGLAAIASFVLLFYLLTRGKMKYIEELALGLKQISKGNLRHKVPVKSEDELGQLAGSINEMADELRQTHDDERKAEQTKQELITNVSHDLRTPLTVILGYLRLMKDRNYENEKQAMNYANIAYGKAEKLQELVEDLFEYTRISNREEELRLEPVSLTEVLRQLIEEMVTLAEENLLTISSHFPKDHFMVNIDPPKMIRCFENLISNAVKYSRKPGNISVELLSGAGYVRVCVANKTEPIPPEDLPRLFERFYRADASRSSETGGSGLGLAIAKSIVEAHGGTIWAESQEDEIRFWVRLKLA